MGSEYKESKDNPLHREYGIWSNTVYILRKMWQYKPGVLFLVILGIVCDSVLSYFWGIFGKYVIDIIQSRQVSHKSHCRDNAKYKICDDDAYCEMNRRNSIR